MLMASAGTAWGGHHAPPACLLSCLLACVALFCNLCRCAAVCACAQATDAANAAYLPTKAELCKAAGVTEADVLLFEPDTNTTRPAHAVWVDQKNWRIVWGFRGTTDLNVSSSSGAGSIGACEFACAAAQAGRQPPLQQRGQQRQTASSHCSNTGSMDAGTNNKQQRQSHLPAVMSCWRVAAAATDTSCCAVLCCAMLCCV